MNEQPATNYAEYTARFPIRVKNALDAMRAIVRTALPDARECIGYGMPAFALDGKTIVWFGAFTAHVGLYPGAAAVAAFREELRSYVTAKGSIRFPLDRALPEGLIARIVSFAAQRRRDAAGGRRTSS